ncbi:Serine/threonine-protein kinase PrkC [Rubripirellula tenax]|uniref:Serine/threonine-protein kinase PrkC n=1 Tax=Rubripirellula tenax TaxID=2528015 RepID=A0A5C6F3H1_9BACT|nr:serine/threonine-protein kinase [Rubripirellula tenax]TWU54339.1 Serine/threonine-protein kinase PrkC [Rubripirellula tenax]
MNPDDRIDFEDLPSDQMLFVNRCCDQFEETWQRDGAASLSMFLDSLECSDARTHLILQRELSVLDAQYRKSLGVEVSIKDYSAWCKSLTKADLDEITRAVSQTTNVADRLHEGQRVGDYVIEMCIGRGGMGQVYRARHELMGRKVAIKVLLQQTSQDPQARRRFEREVQSVAAMSHPNVLTAFDARDADGMLCLVTEWIDGQTLADRVRETGSLSVTEAIDLCDQAASGLQYAHESGFIHRDVKPSNLLVDAAGNLKVLDLGLAKLRQNLDGAVPSDRPHDDVLTKSHHIMGTAEFLSPEQARFPDQVDVQSDIYSLGCTLFFLITGNPPYCGDSPLDTVLSHIESETPSLARSNEDAPVPAALVDLVQSMMAKDPADRPRSMTEVRLRFAELQNHSPSPLAMPPTPVSRKRVRQGIAIATCIAGILLVVAASISSSKPTQPTATSNGLIFNGQTSYAMVPDFEVPIPGQSMIEVVVTPRAGRLPCNVVTWTGDTSLVLFIMQGRKWGIATLGNGKSALEVTVDEMAMDETCLVAARWIGDDLELWINGKKAETQPIAYPLFPNDPMLCFGGTPAGMLPDEQGTRFFRGTIHSLRLSKHPLPDPAVYRSGLDSQPSTLALFEMRAGQDNTTTDATDHRWTASLFDTRWAD